MDCYSFCGFGEKNDDDDDDDDVRDEKKRKENRVVGGWGGWGSVCMYVRMYVAIDIGSRSMGR